jgi:RNA polymerase sigma-70 factor (ECF subfamily)
VGGPPSRPQRAGGSAIARLNSSAASTGGTGGKAAPDFDDPAFIALLRGRDEGAYRQLIRRYHRSLVGLASSITGSRALGEEVVQDAWLAVLTGIAGFESRSSLASWLFRIVLNRARTHVGREARMVSLAISGDEATGDGDPDGLRFTADGHYVDPPRLWDTLDPEREIAGRQLWEHAQAVIDTMPSGPKAVIILRDIEGVSAAEACRLLEISPENQRVLLHRARERVRRAIDLLTAATMERSPH